MNISLKSFLCLFFLLAQFTFAQSLFEELPTEQTQSFSKKKKKNKKWHKRAKKVQLNLSTLHNSISPRLDVDGGFTLTQLPEELTIELFDGEIIVIHATKQKQNRKGAIVWHGFVEGEENSEVHLLIKKNRITGHISFAGRNLKIKNTKSDLHKIIELDNSYFETKEQHNDVVIEDQSNSFIPQVPPTAEADENGNVQIDILVAYTTGAKTSIGGQQAMLDEIDAAISTSNQIYQNSGVNIQLNLVHAEEVSYTQASGMGTDLSRLQNKADGYMDNLHTLRDTHGADMVALMVGSGNYCGIAYLFTGNAETNPFSVTSYTCAVGNKSFPHELGHNMGATHDRHVASGGAYNYGYVNLNERWRTVMAYNTQCSDNGVYCSRLAYFSNPDTTYNGNPTGVAIGNAQAAFNAKVLNDNANTIANYRSQGVTHTITASALVGGSISPNGAVSVTENQNQLFTITPSQGYEIVDVLVDGASVGAVSTYTFSNVAAAHTIEASFQVTTTNSYTITASSDANSSISPNGSSSINQGLNQTYTISANSGYTIADVTVDGVSVGAQTSYTFNNVSTNHTIAVTATAVVLPTYTISANSDANSSISPNGNTSVAQGNNQTYTISANSGYTIADVTVDGVSVGTQTSYTFNNVAANHTIAVTSSIISTGGCTVPAWSSSTVYTGNEEVSYSNKKWRAKWWTQNNQPGAETYGPWEDLGLCQTATQHTITASSDANSSISPNGNTSVTQGDNQTYTISANSGYTIADVTVDGVSLGAQASYTFNNVTANHTITVTATAIVIPTYTISASADANSSISPNGNTSVTQGNNQTYTISANSGYTISDVTVDGVSVGAQASYTFNSVTANHTIAVTATPVVITTYTISASADANSSISPNGNTSVTEGNNQTYTISANSGYTIADVTIDGVSIGAQTSYTFSNVTANHTIAVTATPVVITTYTISASADANSSISPTGNTTVTQGDNQAYTISANSGYTINDVTVDGVSIGSNLGTQTTHTFTNVTANHTIAVTATIVTTGGCTDPAWSSSTVYTGGEEISYLNKKWRAKWWTQNNEPGTETWGPWEDLGACQ